MRDKDDEAARAWRIVAGEVRLAVRVTPRASRSRVEGLIATAGGREVLAVRLAAAPVDGEANAALVALLADVLGLRKSDVTILAGPASREKRLALRGDAGTIEARLRALASAG